MKSESRTIIGYCVTKVPTREIDSMEVNREMAENNTLPFSCH